MQFCPWFKRGSKKMEFGLSLSPTMTEKHLLKHDIKASGVKEISEHGKLIFACCVDDANNHKYNSIFFSPLSFFLMVLRV